MKLLEVKNLNAYYGESQALFSLNFDVEKGELVALVGRNGVGKTTTLLSIMGLVKSEGKVIFSDTDISSLPTPLRFRKGVCLVPDDLGIFNEFTVLENLLISVRKRLSKEPFDLDVIFDLFPTLRDFTHRKAGTLSGGERKMLGLARGLLLNPKLLMIDEPSEGLGPKVVHSIAEVLLKVKREYGLTLLISDQNLRLIKSVADRIYALDKGQIKFSGKISDLSHEELVKVIGV